MYALYRIIDDDYGYADDIVDVAPRTAEAIVLDAAVQAFINYQRVQNTPDASWEYIVDMAHMATIAASAYAELVAIDLDDARDVVRATAGQAS